MRAHECCHVVDGARAVGGPRLRSAGRRGAKATGWVLPSTLMVLMPKCPACVVAYVAIVTGAGISVSMAAHLRLLVLVLCVVMLVWLAAKPLLRIVRG
ncbi:MAG TPA: hypothetical protein VK578_13315 [Edaphobacter sp.]|nr:hypothetical protein [Edaphobacter sp.]